MKVPTGNTLQGTPISPGLARGTLYVHRAATSPLDMPSDFVTHNPDEEISRLDSATVNISGHLLTLASRVEKEIDSKLAEVFGVHQLILNDRSLQDELRKEIAENLVSAASAVKTVFLRWENRFQLMESQIARDKGDDMRDISNRLCDALAGISIHPLEGIPYRCVLATTRLLPSEILFLSSRSTAAVLLEFGSAGSHAALFAREMGLPCISGIEDLLERVPDGALAFVDADEGRITIHPDEQQQSAFRAKIRLMKRATRLARDHAMLAAFTRKGSPIPVLANVGCRDDTDAAMENGADGVGLYRIEQAYLGRAEPPTADELLLEIRRTLEPAKGRSVCVRLLDVGADKPLPFLKFMAESNPSLGRRGVRLLRQYPELLDTQLRTLLLLSEEFDLRILVPMVTLPEDMALVRERLSGIASEMNLASVPKLGAMIEIPAAALSAGALSEHADFFSFGTNDLTQYTFAADRENAAVERYFDDTADAIFRLIQITRGDVPGIPLSLCGELAGHPEHTARLLSCGIESFSVAPLLIPAIKEQIRNA
jgi:phosphoenolpyruvate-protein phosphotransferase